MMMKISGKQFRMVCALGAGFALLLGVACSWQPTPAASLATGNAESQGIVISQQTAAAPYDVVQVRGIGRVTDVPDLATLSLAVSVTADTVAAARDSAAGVMVQVRSSLAANGIADRDIATSYFSIYPDYDYVGDTRVLVGYTVSNGLTVTVRDTDNVGTVIDDAITAGGDDIRFNNLSYSFSNTATLERRARSSAVADMQDKASQLAQFAGRELGDLKVVSETPPGDFLGGSFEFDAVAAPAARATPISAGEGEVTVIVYGVYELLPPASQ